MFKHGSERQQGVVLHSCDGVLSLSGCIGMDVCVHRAPGIPEKWYRQTILTFMIDFSLDFSFQQLLFYRQEDKNNCDSVQFLLISLKPI